MGLKTSTIHSRYAMCLLKYGELIHDQSTMNWLFLTLRAIALQKNAAYIHPDWMCYYASALDQLAGFIESDSHYVKALDILNHI